MPSMGGARRPSSTGLRPPRRDSITLSFAARDYLAAHDVPEELVPGAVNAVTRCLALLPGEELVLVAEAEHETLAAALLVAAEACGAKVTAFVVNAEQIKNEAFVARLKARLDEVAASIFIGTIAGLPRAFQRMFLPSAGSTRRHAHMAGVTEAAMRQGMRTDHEEVDSLGMRLVGALANARTIELTTSTGTDVKITCGRPFRNASGIIREGEWARLPGGQVLTVPTSVDGVVVADGGIWMPAGEHPRSVRLKLHFGGGKLTRIDGADADDPLVALLSTSSPDMARVGDLGFGTNIGLLTFVGTLVQDVAVPGAHMVLGRPFGDMVGEDWVSDDAIALLVRRADVTVDGRPLLVRSRYTRDLTTALSA